MYIKISYFCRIRNLPYKLQKKNTEEARQDHSEALEHVKHFFGSREAAMPGAPWGMAWWKRVETNELAKTWNET